MSIHRSKWRWRAAVAPAVAVLVIVLVGSVRALDRPMPIEGYRLISPSSIGLETITGPGSWTRVTGVSETSSSIMVTVNSLQAPLPGSDVGQFLELVINLDAPLGARLVIDGSSGETASAMTCPPAMWAQGTCSDGD
jgi:hypothetical protein